MTDGSSAMAETQSARSGSAARLWALFVILLAVGLVVIAAPRLIAAILRVPGDAGQYDMERNRPMSVGTLDAVIDSRQAAGKWITSGRNSNVIGVAAMNLLGLMEILPVRQPLEEARYLAVAIASLREGLARQPAQPYAWQNLSYALVKRNGPGDLAAAESAWRMATLTGPNEPGLLVARVAMGLLLWPTASQRTRQMVGMEIERAVRLQPRTVARLSLQLGAEAFIRSMLANKPELLSVYNEMARLPEAGSPLFP